MNKSQSLADHLASGEGTKTEVISALFASETMYAKSNPTMALSVA